MGDLFGHFVRDNPDDDCISGDYEPGTPNGECESDGHYLCANCIHRVPKTEIDYELEEDEIGRRME